MSSDSLSELCQGPAYMSNHSGEIRLFQRNASVMLGRLIKNDQRSRFPALVDRDRKKVV